MKTENDLYRLATELANQLFHKKVDKSGTPYINHLNYVHSKVASLFGNNPTHPASITALLHDVLEDTNTTPSELKRIGFTDEIIEMIVTLSKPSKSSYLDYIKFIGKQSDAIILIKLCDLYHNMDLLRLDQNQWTEVDLARLEKYQQAYLYLARILADRKINSSHPL